MTAPFSDDLRIRVVDAIERGKTRRDAATQFGVSVASAVRWHQRYRLTGSVRPDAIGGDRNSHRAEAFATVVLGWIDEDKDITIPEICGRLKERGHLFATSTIWRLLDRHDYTLKKRQAMQQSKTAPM